VGFVYEEVGMHCHEGQPELIEIMVEPHGGIRGRWQFVPLWGIPTWFRYAPRRVRCGEHGVVVEHIPWSHGKRPVTCAMMVFLARWARRLSWRETAQGCSVLALKPFVDDHMSDKKHVVGSLLRLPEGEAYMLDYSQVTAEFVDRLPGRLKQTQEN
jgi:hypothetical protein